MKRKLLLVACALLENTVMWAITGSVLSATTQDCFLYNVGAEQYLTAGDWWGTHTAISPAGMDLDLTKVSDGVYTIGTRQKGSQFLNGVWMDSSSFNFTFSEVDAVNHYYTISYDNGGNTTYLYYTGSTVDATTTAPTGNAYYWQIVTRSNFLSGLSGATSASPKDATGAIYNAGFFALDYATVKAADFPSTRSWQGTQLTDTWGYRANESGATGSNYCVEQAGKSFDNYQDLTGLPDGVYVLKNQGFYRGDNPAYLYAGSKKVAMEKITSAYDAPEGYTGNDLQRSSYAFGIADLYHNTVPAVYVYGGNLRVGVNSDSKSIDWACFDNFTLSYLGIPSATNAIDVDCTSDPINMTNKITNPDFATTANDGVAPSGWTKEGTHGNFRSSNGAVECWHGTNFKFFQNLSDLPNGVYDVTVQMVNGEGANTAYLYATSSAISFQTVVTQSCAGSNWDAQKNAIAANAAYGKLTAKAIVTDGTLQIGIAEPSAGNTWVVFDNFILTYKGTNAAIIPIHTEKAAALSAKISPLSSGLAKTRLQAIYDANTSDLTTYEDYLDAIINIDNAINNFTALVQALNEYEFVRSAETTIGNVTTAKDNTSVKTTMDGVASTTDATINSATEASVISTQTATLRAAIKTYINAAEPANEGEYFDITCLMANPGFDNNTIDGWTKESSLNPNTRIQCNEFYGSAAFDFYQTIEGLPNGSYTLSMKAFQRPGSYNDVYTDYAAGINNATAKVYVNSDASVVMNIMEEMGNAIYTTDETPFNNDKQPTGASGYVPNSMEGAAAWFAAGKYKKEVAAIVKDGSLRLGFKDDAHVGDVWTLFDDFCLRYYGSSEMIYLKQYLPQLETEIANDYLNNALYDVLKTGQTERAALASANAANADELDTEDDLQAAIDAIIAARDNFVAAKTAYDNLNAKTTAYDDKINVGDGVFQMSSTQKTTFDGAVSSASTMYSTGTASKAETEAALAAIDAAYILNAPSSSTHYNIKVATSEHEKLGNAIVMSLGATSDNNPTGYLFNASAAPASYLAQAVTFTSANDAEHPNRYYITFEGTAGSVYLTNGTNNGSAAGHKAGQIQGTTDSSKKLGFDIVATTTANVFNIYNTETNGSIACQSEGNIYTQSGNADFSVAEATVASVDVNIAAGKFATRIFPFTPSLPSAVDAYTANEVSDGKLTLTKVDAPAANTPYILYSKDGYSGAALTGWGTASTTSYAVNNLTGVYTASTILQSTETVKNYILATENGEQSFYIVDTEDYSATAYRAYLTITSGASAKLRILFGDDDANGIDAVTAAADEVEAIYTVNGTKVNALQPGLNIMKLTNGTVKKVLVK